MEIQLPVNLGQAHAAVAHLEDGPSAGCQPAVAYFALAMARGGDVRGAARFALDAIQTAPWSVHTLAMAASDVLTAVPRDDRTDEVQELRTYALPVPGP